MPDLSRLPDLENLRADLAADLLSYEHFVGENPSIWVQLPYDPYLQDLLDVDTESPYQLSHFLEVLDDAGHRDWLLAELSPDINLPLDATVNARSKAALLQATNREICELELASIGEFLKESDSTMDPHILGSTEEAAQLALTQAVGSISLVDLEGSTLNFFGALATMAALLRADPRSPFAEWPKAKSAVVRDRVDSLQLVVFSIAEKHDLTYRLHGYEEIIAELAFTQLTTKAPRLNMFRREAAEIKAAVTLTEEEFNRRMETPKSSRRLRYVPDPDSNEVRRIADLVEHHAGKTSRLVAAPDEIPDFVPTKARRVLKEFLSALQLAAADQSNPEEDRGLRQDIILLNSAIDHYQQAHELRTGQLNRADLNRPQPAAILETRTSPSLDQAIRNLLDSGSGPGLV